MSLSFNYFAAGFENRAQLDTLYRRFLDAWELTDEQMGYTCWADDADSDPEDWACYVDDELIEQLGFVPRVRVNFQPAVRAEQGRDNVLRFVGFLLSHTTGNAALMLHFETVLLARRDGEITLHGLQAHWSPESYGAFDEGLRAAVEAA